MIFVADTGFAVAVVSADDRYHKICNTFYKQATSIYLPQSVLTEVAQILRRDGGTSLVIKFIHSLPTSKYALLPMKPEIMARTAELLEQYQSTRIDFVDCTVVAAAENLNIRQILTIDHRDFSIIKPRHAEYFELFPPVHTM